LVIHALEVQDRWWLYHA